LLHPASLGRQTLPVVKVASTVAEAFVVASAAAFEAVSMADMALGFIPAAHISAPLTATRCLAVIILIQAISIPIQPTEAHIQLSRLPRQKLRTGIIVMTRRAITLT
jgi:hypothetical protein